MDAGFLHPDTIRVCIVCELERKKAKGSSYCGEVVDGVAGCPGIVVGLSGFRLTLIT